MADNGPVPIREIAIIHFEGEIGSAVLDVTTVNCNPIQLLGAAEVLHAIGMQALAALQQSQVMTPDPHQLVVAQRLPS